ncbi:hypothetical protein L838_0351 [Mycobacterium avium MAV_120709_2344]|nr:hypothetical protein L838_0351 [Mycobacterium avium MAV_120709_2344]
MKHGIAAGHRVLHGCLIGDVDGDEALDVLTARLEPAPRPWFVAYQQAHLVARIEQRQYGVSAN